MVIYVNSEYIEDRAQYFTITTYARCATRVVSMYFCCCYDERNHTTIATDERRPPDN